MGFLVGGLIGMTGVGGGVLTTPLLIIVFGVQPSIAIGTDLFYAAVTKIIGAIKHRQQNTVNLRIALTLAAGSIPSALLGVGLARILKEMWGPAVEPMITVVLAWVCILMAVIMVVRLILERRWGGLSTGRSLLSPRQQQVLTFALGIVTGLLVSTTSIGAGSIVMIFLVMLYGMPAKQLVGTDVFHAAILASVSALGHLWAGNVDPTLAALLLVGSIPGVIFGSRMSLQLPDTGLRISLALILAFSGTRLIMG